ncbi:hypothetical protein ACUOHX_25435, partial [Escherichia coli]
GLPLFGVMVGAVARGEVIGAAILDPMTDSMALAVRGEGAWEVQADGSERDLRVAPPAPLEQLRGAASWRFLPAAMRRDLLPRLQCVGQVWDFRGA